MADRLARAGGQVFLLTRANNVASVTAQTRTYIERGQLVIHGLDITGLLPLTCITSRGHFVFDWEEAADEAPPLIDVLHFQAIQDALAGRSFGLASIGTVYSRIVGKSPQNLDHVRPLLLLYLIDMGLHYFRSSLLNPDAGNSIVLDWIGRELDRRLSGAG